MSAPKRTTTSQDKMQAYREKYDSIAEHTVPVVRELNAAIDRLKVQATDPRREPEPDSRRDSDSTIDVVELDIEPPTTRERPRVPRPTPKTPPKGKP